MLTEGCSKKRFLKEILVDFSSPVHLICIYINGHGSLNKLQHNNDHEN